MIHYQVAPGTMKNGAAKKYAIAVLIGFLLGGAYAVAEQRPGSQAHMPLPKLPAVQGHISKTLRAGEACGACMEAVGTWAI